MSGVTPIGKQGVTPEVLAQYLAKDVDQIDEVYIVAFSKTGEVWQYISGDAKGMCFAAAILQEHALAASGKK
jgi:hypothetical protein